MTQLRRLILVQTEKKILHLSHTDIRTDSRILKEIHGALNNGYEVYAIGIQDSERSPDINSVGLKLFSLRLVGKKLTLMPKVIRHAIVFLELFMRMFLICVKYKPDLIHCNDTVVLPIGVFLKILKGCALVYDAHELESDRNGLSPLLGKVIFFIEKKLWRYLDGLIVVSPSILNWYQKKFPVIPSEVVLNSPQIERVSSSRNDYLRDKFDIPTSDLIYIHVGILAPGRGIDNYVRAFKSQANAHLVFLGYGTLFKKLSDLAAVESNIHIHDPVDHEEVVSIIKAADVGLCLIENVSLSDFYSLPNKLFEYAFAGLKIVGSNFPDITEVLTKYQLGLSVEPTSEGVLDAIRYFETHGIIDEANQDDLSELAWDAQLNKLLSLYRNLGV